jgi:hypothetical protein
VGTSFLKKEHQQRQNQIPTYGTLLPHELLVENTQQWRGYFFPQKEHQQRQKVSKFLEKTADGIFYGNRALTALLKNTDGLAAKLGITNLTDYKIFNEVQLWVNETAGEFMKADIVLVKYAPNGTTIQEVILIENKLSAGTLLTARQNVGVTTLKNGGTLKVKAPSSSKKIETINGVETIVPEIGANAKTIGKDIDISVAANKRKKISDGGNKNGAFNVSGLEPN